MSDMYSKGKKKYGLPKEQLAEGEGVKAEELSTEEVVDAQTNAPVSEDEPTFSNVLKASYYLGRFDTATAATRKMDEETSKYMGDIATESDSNVAQYLAGVKGNTSAVLGEEEFDEKINWARNVMQRAGNEHTGVRKLLFDNLLADITAGTVGRYTENAPLELTKMAVSTRFAVAASAAATAVGLPVTAAFVAAGAAAGAGYAYVGKELAGEYKKSKGVEPTSVATAAGYGAMGGGVAAVTKGMTGKIGEIIENYYKKRSGHTGKTTWNNVAKHTPDITKNEVTITQRANSWDVAMTKPALTVDTIKENMEMLYRKSLEDRFLEEPPSELEIAEGEEGEQSVEDLLKDIFGDITEEKPDSVPYVDEETGEIRKPATIEKEILDDSFIKDYERREVEIYDETTAINQERADLLVKRRGLLDTKRELIQKLETITDEKARAHVKGVIKGMQPELASVRKQLKENRGKKTAVDLKKDENREEFDTKLISYDTQRTFAKTITYARSIGQQYNRGEAATNYIKEGGTNWNAREVYTAGGYHIVKDDNGRASFNPMRTLRSHNAVYNEILDGHKKIIDSKSKALDKINYIFNTLMDMDSLNKSINKMLITDKLLKNLNINHETLIHIQGVVATEKGNVDLYNAITKGSVLDDEIMNTLATNIRELNKEIVSQYHQNGILLDSLDGYVPQDHNPASLERAGKQKWIQDIIGTLDHDKTFSKLTPYQRRMDYLRKRQAREMGRISRITKKAHDELYDKATGKYKSKEDIDNYFAVKSAKIKEALKLSVSNYRAITERINNINSPRSTARRKDGYLKPWDQMSDDEKRAVAINSLDIIYDSITKNEGFITGAGIGISKKYRKQRILHFAGGKQYYNYSKKHGRKSTNILTATIEHAKRHSRSLALHTQFGENPKGMINELMRHTRHEKGTGIIDKTAIAALRKNIANVSSYLFNMAGGKSYVTEPILIYFKMGMDITHRINLINTWVYPVLEDPFVNVIFNHTMIPEGTETRMQSLKRFYTEQPTSAEMVSLGIWADVENKNAADARWDHTDAKPSALAYKIDSTVHSTSKFNILNAADPLAKRNERIADLQFQTTFAKAASEGKTWAELGGGSDTLRMAGITEEEWNHIVDNAAFYFNYRPSLPPEMGWGKKIPMLSGVKMLNYKYATLKDKNIAHKINKAREFFIEHNVVLGSQLSASAILGRHANEQSWFSEIIRQLFGVYKGYQFKKYANAFKRLDFTAHGTINDRVKKYLIQSFMAGTMLAYAKYAINGKKPKLDTTEDKVTFLTEIMSQSSMIPVLGDYAESALSGVMQGDVVESMQRGLGSRVGGIGAAKAGKVTQDYLKALWAIKEKETAQSLYLLRKHVPAGPTSIIVKNLILDNAMSLLYEDAPTVYNKEVDRIVNNKYGTTIDALRPGAFTKHAQDVRNPSEILERRKKKRIRKEKRKKR